MPPVKTPGNPHSTPMCSSGAGAGGNMAAGTARLARGCRQRPGKGEGLAPCRHFQSQNCQRLWFEIALLRGENVRIATVLGALFLGTGLPLDLI